MDDDGISDDADNCLSHPNGPNLGTYTSCAIGETCTNVDICCGGPVACSMNQEDTDFDGLGDVCDNCPHTPNGPYGGTCIAGSFGTTVGSSCNTNEDCGPGGNCDISQTDTFPSGGNGIGDACECEGDFNCDGDVDYEDVSAFLMDLGRNVYFYPCTNENPCNGDLDCDTDVDALDVLKFIEDFLRNRWNTPCPTCDGGNWCVY